MQSTDARMNPDVKEKWIAALLSGEYKQGKLCLRSRDDTFCCLGVLTDLFIKHNRTLGGDVDWEHYEMSHPEGYGKMPVYRFASEHMVLPKRVQEWAEFPSKNGVYDFNPNGDHNGCLAEENDKGATFAELAEKIEHFF